MSQYNQPKMSTSDKAPAGGSGSLVLIAGAIGIIAVILMNVYVEMRVAASKEDSVTFFEFSDDMKVGQEIELKHLKAIQIPKSMSKAFGTNAVGEDSRSPGKPLDGLGIKLTEPVVEKQILTYSLFRGNGSAAVRDLNSRNMDEITLNIDSKEQPPNLRPGDLVDLYASVPMNRSSEYMRVMEYVKVVDLGDRTQDTGTRSRNNKYGSITIYVEPGLSNKLFDIQKRVDGQTFNVTRRDPEDRKPRELSVGGSKEINERVLKILNLD